MSFAGLSSNQTVSYGNLQDAVDNGIYTLLSTIPSPSNRDSTKSVISATISGFNPNYPPYANKTNNQLIVKSDIYNTGNVTLSPQYGMYFASIDAYGTGFPSFSYPVNYLQTVSYVNSISAQALYIYLNGTRYTTPLSISTYVDNVLIDCQNITSNGYQLKVVNLPNNVYAPSSIFIAIDSGSCAVTPPAPVFPGKCFSTVAVNRGSGQYMSAGNTNIYNSSGFTQGYLYYSLNYGSTWNKSSLYGYWKKIAYSDNGQYVIAVESYGKAYLSSNYGVSFTEISGLAYSLDSYNSAALSSDGQYQMIVSGNAEGEYGSSVAQVSNNYGSTWNIVNNAGYFTFYSCAMDASGSNFLVGAGGGGTSYIQKSTNQGSTWSDVFTNTIGSSVNDININASNGWAIASQYGTQYAGSYLIKSSNSGSSWTQTSGGSAQQSWVRAIVNNTVSGKALYYLGNTGTSYIQQITGLGPAFMGTVSNLTSSGNRNWHALANNDDGTYVLTGTGNGLFLSTNGGSSFNQL
jgi:hypothetical protein